MPQLDYSLFQTKGFEGALATAEGTRTYSRVNGESTILPFGRVVVPGASDGEVVLPSATGQTAVGITYVSNIYEVDKDTVGYAADKDMNVLLEGEIYMVAEDAVSAWAPVYFRHTANTSPGATEAIGRVRSNVDTDKADLLPNARFTSSATAGELVKVAVNLPYSA